MTEWLQNDPLFAEQLAIGHAHAQAVADMFRQAGCAVLLTPMQMRASVDKRHEFSDEYDLRVDGKRVEVKSRAVAFTSPDDYPYRTAFVYSERGWRAKAHRPVAIILVSQVTGAAVVVPVSTEPQWTKRVTHDRVRGIEYTVLEVESAYLESLDAMIAWLRPTPRAPEGCAICGAPGCIAPDESAIAW